MANAIADLPLNAACPAASLDQTKLNAHQRLGEQRIGLLQALLALAIIDLLAFSTAGKHLATLNSMVYASLGAFIISSLLRIAWARSEYARNFHFCLLNIADAGLIVAIVWHYNVASHHLVDAGATASATAFLFTIAGIRALRFNCRGVIVTAGALIAWWCIAWLLIRPDGSDNILLASTVFGTFLPLAVMTAGIAIGSRQALLSATRLQEEKVENQAINGRLSEQTRLWQFQAALLEITTRNTPTIQTATAVCKTIETFVGSGTAMIMKLVDGALFPIAAPHADSNWVALLQGLPAKDMNGSCGTAAFCGHPQYVDNTESDPRWSAFVELALQHSIRACWSHPIIGPRGVVNGTISLSFATPRAPTEMEKDLLRVAAYFLGSSIDNETQSATEIAMQSELKAAEALARKTKLFLATMTHEIRTPMNGVIGALDLIQTAKTSDERDALLGTAIEASENLLCLINDILDISRIEAEGVSIVESPADFAKLVEGTVRLMQPIAQKRGLALTCSVQGGPLPYVFLDEPRLRQVLYNIVGNALKFTQQGSVSIVMEGRPLDASRCQVKMQISDTGMGIPADKLDSIFDRFRMVDASYSRQSEGTGLGLTICREIVQAMGGSITVKSELGRGSTFEIELPLRVANAVGGNAVQRLPIQTDMTGDRCHVLLAEDNETNAMIATKILEQEGYFVVRARNGKEALERARAQSFDVILMDVSMPEMDGLEATHKIREMGGWNGDVPIVALTAHAADRVGNEFLAAGMTGYLAKPIRRSTLLDAIHSMKKSSGGEKEMLDVA